MENKLKAMSFKIKELLVNCGCKSCEAETQLPFNESQEEKGQIHASCYQKYAPDRKLFIEVRIYEKRLTIRITDKDIVTETFRGNEAENKMLSFIEEQLTQEN